MGSVIIGVCMLENEEFTGQELSVTDLGLLRVLDSVEGRCIQEIDSYAQFDLVEFEDYTHARAPLFKPKDHRFRFKTGGPPKIRESSGPYRFHHEAGHALMTALYCLAGVRNTLISSGNAGDRSSEIKIPALPEDLEEFAAMIPEEEDPGKKFVKNGIAIARSHLFSELVPEDKTVCRRYIGTRDDGTQIQIQIYKTVIDGVLW